jgi:hypothetical protein
VLPNSQMLAFEKRNGLVQDRDVAGRLDIVCGSVGEPYPIVGNARPHALAGRRQPPMLDIPFDELPGRSA